jgi:hypothetical protein
LQFDMTARSETPPASDAEATVVLWWNHLSARSSEDFALGSDSSAFFKRHRCSGAQRLSGGYVNFVCRVFLETETSSINGSTQDHAVPTNCASAIVKRFSQSVHNSLSYEIERTALWLGNSIPSPASSPLPAMSIRVPRLLAFDDDTRTIVMEDAGADAKMLSEWLLLPAVQVGDAVLEREGPGTAADVAAGWPELTAEDIASAIAARFSTLRAACSAANLLPSSSMITGSSQMPPFNFQLRPPASYSEQREWYEQFSAQALAFGVPSSIVEALAPVETPVPGAIGCHDVTASHVADAPAIVTPWRRRSDAVHDGWDWSVAIDSECCGMNASDVPADSSKGPTAVPATAHAFSPADLSLIVGDLWPNSVLVDPLQRTIWIVDWEAAQIGRSGRDVALLLDHLWIMTQNPSKYDAVRAQKLIRSFASVFFPPCKSSVDADLNVVDWRLGREPEFLRSVAMFAGSPHYGIDHSAALRCALEEISALAGLGKPL